MGKHTTDHPESRTPDTDAQPLVGRRQFALGGIGAVLLFGSFRCGSPGSPSPSGPGSSSSGSSSSSSGSDTGLSGMWTFCYQWSGGTSGVLTLIINADNTYQIPATTGVDAQSGTVSFDDASTTVTLNPSNGGITWFLYGPSSTQASGEFYGNYDFNGPVLGPSGPGTFTAFKGAGSCPGSSSSSSGGASSGSGSGGCTGCSGGCSGSCSGGCSSGCSGGCTGCGGGCTGGCSGMCQGSCSGCSGSCQGAD